MKWCFRRKDDNLNKGKKSTNNKISRQSNTDSVANLIDEFDDQRTTYIAHHYCIRTEIDYIKRIKEEAHDQSSAVIHTDFTENYSLIVQHEVQ